VSRTALAAIAAFATTALVTTLLIVVVTTGATALQCLPDEVQVTGVVPTDARLDAAQARNAITIVRETVARRMPTRAARHRGRHGTPGDRAPQPRLERGPRLAGVPARQRRGRRS
jgi:hypothetical protein